MIFVHETDFRNVILNFFHFWSSSNRKFIQKSDAAILRNQESDFNAIALLVRVLRKNPKILRTNDFSL